MKRIITFILFVFFSVNWQAKAQFSENFDAGVPGSMTQVHINNAIDWTGCNGDSGPAACPYNGAESAQLFEDDYNNSQTALVTPVMDLSSGAYQLKFSHVQPEWSGDQNTLNVEISTDNGASWTQIVEYLDDISDWIDETILLDNYTLTATTQFRFIGTVNYGYAIGLDDIVVEPQPSCLPVSDLSASNFTNNSADLSWTENGSATAWNIEYGPAGFTQGNGTVVAASSNPFTLTGLSSATNYDFYVQADCGSGDTSTWEGPYTFRTECDVISTFPYNYGFEDVTSNQGGDWINSCWSGNPENTGSSSLTGPYRWTPNDGDTPSFNTGPANAHNGTIYAYTEASGSAAGDVAELISPIFDLSSLTQPQLTFYYYMYGADIGTLSVDTYDGSTWTNDVWTISGQQQTSDSDSWLEAVIPLTSSVTKIKLRAIRGNDFKSDIAVDDIMIQEAPSCSHPSLLSASNITDDSADLSWTETGTATAWNIEYGPTGFTQGSGTVVAVSSNPYTLTGLASSTEYDFYVQADCGGGDTSSWEGPYTFRTECDIINTFPYNYGFEDTTSNTGGDWYPSCWSGDPQNTGAGTFAPPFRWTPNEADTPSSNTGPANARSGSKYAYTEASGSNNGDVAELISPIFDLSSLTQPQLTFYYYMYGADIGTLSVDTYDGSTWTNDVWTLSGQQQTSDSDSWLEANVNFANTVTKIRFRAIRADGYLGDMAIDDILIQEQPSCLHPVSLSASNITVDSAELSWTENGSATTWNIEYGPTGFAQGQGTTVAVTNNPYTLTGLTSATSYDFYVQADCGGGDTSTWEGPYTFITPGTCGFFRVDLIDSWGDGWNGGLLTVYINGTSYMNLSLDNGNGPESYNIPVNTGDILSFEYIAGSFSEENQYIVYDNNDNEVANEGANDSVPGNVGDPNVPNGLEACPSCPKPTNLSASNITVDSAELSWTENGSATTWNIEYGPAGFAQGQGTTVAVTGNPYTLTGLTSATSYDFYVQADCGGGDTSTWEGPYSFMTPGTCGFFRVDLIDDYGDGWNGGLLTIYVNGTSYLNLTLDDDYGPETYYIPVDQGDVLSFDYTPGTYSDENEYVVYDNNNLLVADEGANQTEPGDIGDPTIPNGLEACPSCPKPTYLSASNITAHSADVSWTENGSATTWNIEYGPAGFTQGQGTTVAVTNNPYTLTGLTSATNYDFYVQADCGGGDTSMWEGPYTFTTLCDPQLPYSQDFDADDNCWTIENANMDDKTWTRGTGATPISCISDDTDYVMFVKFNTTQDMDDWLFSPGFNLTAGTTYGITFSYGNDGTTNFEESLDVYISTSDNSSGAVNGTQLLSETAIVDGCHDFSNYNVTVPTDGVYYVAFHGKSIASQDILMIDDFSMYETTGAVNELTNITGIYPNPTTGEFVIKSHDLNNAKVFVYSMSGKEIYNSTIDSDAYSINLRNVKNGVYFVKITSDNKSYISKLIIK